MASGHQPPAKTRSAAAMFPLIRQWERSGLRQKDFCNQQGIKPPVFWYWLRRYREEEQPAGKDAPGFVSIEMDAPVIELALAEVIYPDGTRLVFKERVGLAFLHTYRTKEELVAENQQLRASLGEVQAELAELKRLIFGRKSERFVAEQVPADQLNLFVQHDYEGTEEKTVLQAVQAHSRQKAKPKRMKLPDDLPVVVVRIDPHPDEIQGWVKIGEEITEELDYIPGYLRINRYIRPKYARPKSEQNADTEGKNIFIAPLPSRVIDKGIPSAGLLAYILVSKFVDHLPYHRIIQIFKRAGMDIPASTVNGWVAKCIDLLRVLYLWHKARLMECDYLMADETKIRVLKAPNQAGKKAKAHQGYFWVYYDSGGKQTLFIYDPGRAGKYPREHLKSFKGHLQTDGYKVYDAFDQTEAITLVGCMAHIRRKFEKALDNPKAPSGRPSFTPCCLPPPTVVTILRSTSKTSCSGCRISLSTAWTSCYRTIGCRSKRAWHRVR